jgi:5-methylcytosine-specific restriction endonuclease McrA
MTHSVKLDALWRAIEDELIPSLKLDAYERSVYYHLVRHSLVVGQATLQVSIDSLAARTGLSSHVRQKLRALESKGCIKILDRNRSGTQIEVFAPNAIPGCKPQTAVVETFDIEVLDCYSDPRGRAAIIAREAGKCYYCMRLIDDSNAVLDHAIPQADRIDHSYRNMVACCHECNSLKSGMAAHDFVRLLYRRGRLGGGELEERLSALDALARGDLKPQLDAGGFA